MTVVDLFAGPGGLDLGARALGLEIVGVENDRDTCKTRIAAGLETVFADVQQVLPNLLTPDPVAGLLASPPCPDFSSAGLHRGIDGRSGHLIFEVPRWIERLAPDWIVLEQVPAALEWWESFDDELTRDGYDVWTGVIDAADFGVPQNRRRAVLIARLDGIVTAPTPTFDAHRSVSDVLGWPAETLFGFARRDDRGDSPDGYRVRDRRRGSEPSFTLTEKARSWTVSFPDGTKRPLEIGEAAQLQTFPADYPFRGSRSSQFRQCANAVPPMLAQVLIETVVTS